ncbi:hypothetical protein ACNKHM_15835 [Shigella sonnei]
MHTDDTLVDGLEADIATKRSANLVRRDLRRKRLSHQRFLRRWAWLRPLRLTRLSARQFAASKVLGPWWSKVSILRYHISGPLDDPQINKRCDNRAKKKRNDLTRARNCPNSYDNRCQRPTSQNITVGRTGRSRRIRQP